MAENDERKQAYLATRFPHVKCGVFEDAAHLGRANARTSLGHAAAVPEAGESVARNIMVLVSHSSSGHDVLSP